jgi:ubiquinone/menaquinone biosynthesis C-methylase UbiE
VWGDTAISEDMVCDGYQDIVNIDISAVVIEAMREKYKDMPQLQYQRMDVRDMKAFKDGQFDTVLDKGMLDSLMCGASATYSASSMLQEVRRVLKPGGVYLLITYGDPRVRLPHLKAGNFLWEVVLHVIRKFLLLAAVGFC